MQDDEWHGAYLLHGRVQSCQQALVQVSIKRIQHTQCCSRCMVQTLNALEPLSERRHLLNSSLQPLHLDTMPKINEEYQCCKQVYARLQAKCSSNHTSNHSREKRVARSITASAIIVHRFRHCD